SRTGCSTSTSSSTPSRASRRAAPHSTQRSSHCCSAHSARPTIWPLSLHGNARCSRWLRRAAPTEASPAGSGSRNAPSRHTSRASSESSASARTTRTTDACSPYSHSSTIVARLRPDTPRWNGSAGLLLPARHRHPTSGARPLRARGPFPIRSWLLGCCPLRENPARPHEVAGVAVRVPLEVVLMLGLGLPERARGGYLRHDLPRPATGCVDVGDRLLGDAPLLVVEREDRRAVARSDVVALAVRCRRIVDLEEELE